MKSRLTYIPEPFAVFEAESQHLWQGHWEELAPKGMPLGLDLPWYRGLEAEGALVVVLARARGVVVGYQISVVRPHSHYSSVLCGFEDIFYLAPAFRQGLNGVKLISKSVAVLRARGCKKVFFMSNEAKPTDKIFKYLGFAHTHTCYGLELGE